MIVKLNPPGGKECLSYKPGLRNTITWSKQYIFILHILTIIRTLPDVLSCDQVFFGKHILQKMMFFFLKRSSHLPLGMGPQIIVIT